MIELNNDPRGCGRLVKGGCYLQSEQGPDGMLKPWTWVLGTHIYNSVRGSNLTCEVSPRGQSLFDPGVSLMRGELVSLEVGQARRRDLEGMPRQLEALGQWAVIDHVGSNRYSAYSFAQETVQRGPSRRIAPSMAKNLASKTPFRIFFTHSEIPFWTTEVMYQEWLGLNDLEPFEGAREPTWWNEQWGGTLFDGASYTGYDHFVLWALRKKGEWKYPPLFQEAVFGYSWVTRVVYVLNDGETAPPEDLQKAGVIGGKTSS